MNVTLNFPKDVKEDLTLEKLYAILCLSSEGVNKTEFARAICLYEESDDFPLDKSKVF